MISFAAQGRFAAEFVAFLVALGGLALVGLRAELLSERRVARGVLALGFALVAVASFFEGSLIVHDHGDPVLVAVRAAGLVSIGIGSIWWAGGSRSVRLLWLGLGWMGISLAFLAQHVELVADLTLGVGAASVGVALRVASARSIAARVAASSAAILLAVVLVLAVSLSTVLSTTVRDDAGRRLDARAALEADFAERIQPAEASVVARNIALTFASNTAFVNATNTLLGATDPNSGHLSDVSGKLQGIFAEIQSYLAPDLAVAYINAAGHLYALSAPRGFDEGTIGAAVGSAGVKQAFATPTEQARATVQTFGTTAFVVAVQTVGIVGANENTTYPTAIVAIQPLSNDYLNTRKSVDTTVGLALVDRTSVLAQAGSPGSTATLLRLAQRSLSAGGVNLPLTLTQGRLLSTRPVLAGSQPVAVIVAATPDTVVTDVRDKLLRTLFLLAMAGTLLAVALAAYAGERVSGGIRVLTDAAKRIQAGNFAEPVGVTSTDEVGVLAAAFESMASSISDQTTALQRAAEDETALRNQLEAVVAGMSEALLAVDGDGRITLFNRAAEELLGLDIEDVFGEPVGAVLGALAEDGTALAYRLERPTPTRWNSNATVMTEVGSRIPVAISAAPLRGDEHGAVVGAVIVLRDLRPEREVERIKSEFLSRIGHELRTPLTGILGYAEILLRRPVPEARAREMHQQIVDAGRRLYRVVQMLEFSAAAEAGRSLLRSETVNIREVVDEVVDGWTTRVNGNHAVARKTARRLPQVRGDRRWLAMAVDELIDNAVKFSPEGGEVTVTVSATTWSLGNQSRPAVRITVSDHGVGMTSVEEREVFTDFVQADSSDTRRFGGLGLGLSLVKRVAEAHGGAVEVASTPRKGSKFSIVIPALPND
ncbi:MAG: sensor histidine kinase [Acidimicrobiales bacterium]